MAELGIPCPAKYGDPALIMPKFAKAPAEIQYKFELCIIPHIFHHEQLLAHPVSKDPRVSIIPLKNRDVDCVLHQLWQCSLCPRHK